MARSAPHPAPRALPEADADRIVPLFAEAPAASQAIDWPAAIDLLRDVGARVRRAQDFAQEVSRHSQAIIRRSLKQTEEAERRADLAQAEAAAAVARAERAEEVARLSEARAALAERQAQAAVAAEAEAQLWLRRVHACLKDEFQGLVEGGADPADGGAPPAGG